MAAVVRSPTIPSAPPAALVLATPAATTTPARTTTPAPTKTPEGRRIIPVTTTTSAPSKTNGLDKRDQLIAKGAGLVIKAIFCLRSCKKVISLRSLNSV